MARFRHCQFYYDGRRVATCEDGEIDMPSGDEVVIADGEVQGSSDGVMVCKITMNHVIPVGGADVGTLTQDLINKRRPKIECGVIGTKIFSWESMAIDTGNIKWDGKAGKLTGSITLIGGKPNLVG